MEDYKAKDLAKDLGIPAPKISELENNKRDASLTELKAYHKYFNVPYEYLLKKTIVDIMNTCNYLLILA